MPPISSTIKSEDSRISSNEPLERDSTPETSGRRPVIRSTRSACSEISSTNAPPTVPRPSTPILKEAAPSVDIAAHEVVVGLATDDHAGVAVLAEDHWRTRYTVVVVRHRVAVGAGGGGHDDVPGHRVRELHGTDNHVS